MNKYASNLTLLYVEDVPETREMFSLLMEDTFKEIILAKDGQEALEKLQQHSIDLIITDIQMPNMDGLEMMETIKDLKLNIPNIQKITKKLIDTIKKPISYENQPLNISASIGISIYYFQTGSIE